jgi:3-hydroxyisobutyrate dehydrogenase-like beta-hydroxyacid dehydrogenase
LPLRHCTVGGRPEVAEAQLLSIYYAGDPSAKARVLPLLGTLGNRLYDLGQEQSAAAGGKLAVNHLIAAFILAMADAVAFAQKCGVPPEMFSRIVLEASVFGGGGKVFDYIKMLAADAYSPVKFSVPLGEKDIGLMLAAGVEVGVTLPAAERFAALLAQATQKGWGDLEWAVVGRVIAQQAGLPVRDAAGSHFCSFLGSH